MGKAQHDGPARGRSQSMLGRLPDDRGAERIGEDQAGNMITAATVYYGGTSNTDKNNYVAVARTTPGGTTTWGVAGWTQQTTTPPVSTGKAIYQNGTTMIGHLTGSLVGPAVGVPMIDSVGNVWFLAEISLDGPPVVTGIGLLRAVYDPVAFSYKLELVLKTDVIAGEAGPPSIVASTFW